MRITREELEKTAALARLRLSDEEAQAMCRDVGDILEYINKLNEIDTNGVRPTTHAIEVNNAFREDVVHDCLPREEALRNGPRQNGEAFVVPKVIS